MKNLNFPPVKFTAFIFILFLLNGCDEPAPTELVQDDSIEVEVITKDADDEFYSSGYDSTGLVYEPSNYGNVITVSGVKISSRGTTINSSLAQAIFFDRSKPVYSDQGMLIGFRTRLLGNVKFNGIDARQVPLRIRFGSNDVRSDTLLGFKHLLYNRTGINGDDFGYAYNSFVGFELNPFTGRYVNFNIVTPPEVNGTIHLGGNNDKGNLKGVLEWNGHHFEGFEVIVGVSEKGRENIFPLYRIRTKDDGSLEIPSELLNNIPFDRYDRIVFSLIRRIEYRNNVNGNTTLHVLSQSIHSIVVVIP
jgi:hypothetical protein